MTNFRHLTWKKFSDNNFKFVENGRKFFKRVENSVENGEISYNYAQFLLFPVLSKDVNCSHIKTRACLGKG